VAGAAAVDAAAGVTAAGRAAAGRAFASRPAGSAQQIQQAMRRRTRGCRRLGVSAVAPPWIISLRLLDGRRLSGVVTGRY
jgi:hypothetical protein